MSPQLQGKFVFTGKTGEMEHLFFSAPINSLPLPILSI